MERAFPVVGVSRANRSGESGRCRFFLLAGSEISLSIVLGAISGRWSRRHESADEPQIWTYLCSSASRLLHSLFLEMIVLLASEVCHRHWRDFEIPGCRSQPLHSLILTTLGGDAMDRANGVKSQDR